MKCTICPRNCNADRSVKPGFCGMPDEVLVAKAFLHMWEEPCISGTRGSGTVFFSGCNLKCVYCQNYTISQENFGKKVSIEQLTDILLRLQEKGAHNINLVNPTHYIRQIKQALAYSKEFVIPVVYNSNGYESLESLGAMEGVADVYLPDFKYYSAEAAKRYSGAADYFEVVTKALFEMYRQVGGPAFDKEGIVKRGLIIRHLILPGHTGESIKILDWIKANLPEDVYVSVMSQYTPYFRVQAYPEINRRITRREYEKVQSHLFKLGLENGYIQERDSACEEYIPDFDLAGI